MTATEIWVEEIPLRLRVGEFYGHRYGAVEREQTGGPVAGKVVWVHVPETDEERALTPEQFGAKKAVDLGAPGRPLSLVPLPPGWEWLEPSEGVWVLMKKPDADPVVAIPSPPPGLVPGYNWAELEPAEASA